MKRKTGNILVVDDGRLLRELLGRWLSKDGYSFDTAANGEEALKLLESREFDLAIIDIMMPGISGVDLLTLMTTRWPDTAVLIASGSLVSKHYRARPGWRTRTAAHRFDQPDHGHLCGSETKTQPQADGVLCNGGIPLSRFQGRVVREGAKAGVGRSRDDRISNGRFSLACFETPNPIIGTKDPQKSLQSPSNLRMGFSDRKYPYLLNRTMS